MIFGTNSTNVGAGWFKPRGNHAGYKLLVLTALVPLLGAALGCTVNPATGENTFIGTMDSEDEIRIGRQQHPKILKAFGGEYGTPELRRYVASIGNLLSRTVERRNLKYTFTVLNSGIVNAFALPGGYVYISRGLLALAGNEGELAAVLAHELGHITALHHAQRSGQDLLANLLVTGLGIAAGRGASDVGGLLAQSVLRGNSREHERQSDQLGIRYMARAGYDPMTMANFLRRMRANSRLQAKRRGESPDKVDRFNYMATHPAPAERVQKAQAIARATPVANPMKATRIYLSKINGMLFGDDPEQGFVRGNSFAHPKLRFRFKVPKGFRLFNSSRSVVALGPAGARIIFDRASKPIDGPMRYYLSKIWARNLKLSNLDTITINGLKAATATSDLNTDKGWRDVRLVAIRIDLQTIYRFMFVTPPADTEKLALPLRRTTYSFRRLTASEASKLRPLRIKIVTVRRGDTVASMARRMSFSNFARERFEVLNGLRAGARLVAGQRVKLVAD